MVRLPIRRAAPCPHADCDEWAVLASLQDVVEQQAPIWQCPNGHHGPRVIGLEFEHARDE